MSDYTILAGEFSGWAVNVKGPVVQDAVDKQNELNDLNKRAQNLKYALIGLGIAVGVGAAMVIGGFFAGPLAPFLWVSLSV